MDWNFLFVNVVCEWVEIMFIWLLGRMNFFVFVFGDILVDIVCFFLVIIIVMKLWLFDLIIFFLVMGFLFLVVIWIIVFI